MFVEFYIFIIILLSSFLQTATGFGYAIITAPLLALVLDVKDTVVLTIVTGLIVRLVMLKSIRKNGSYQEILPFIPFSLFGAIIGAYMLLVTSNQNLRIFMGIILLFFVTTLLLNYKLPIKDNRFTKYVIGITSGFLATTTSINGPPIILYYLSIKSELSKDSIRGNLTRYFLLINIASIIILYFNKLFVIKDMWVTILLSLPAIYIGNYVGEKFFNYLDIKLFKKISLYMVLLSSITLIITNYE